MLFAAAAAFGALSLLTVGGQTIAPSIRVVLVGDSTVTDESGWGAGLRHLAKPGVEVVNMSASGRSSKSFIDEGLWAKAIE
jgi:hypothetical protein